MSADTAGQPTDTVADTAERFVVTHKHIRVTANKLEPVGLDPEDFEVEQTYRGGSGEVIFEVGDEVPPALGREIWANQSGRLAAYGPDGERLDDADVKDLQFGPDIPDADRFEVLNGDLRLSPSKVRDLPDETIEEYDLDVVPRGRAVIGEGEAIPPEVVASVYASFHDKIAAFDGEGNRVA